MGERGGGTDGPVRALRSTAKAVGLVLALVALVRELRTPPAERTWHGQLGFVPYDLRPPTLTRIREAWWNPEDDRILTPRPFGVGWAVNFAAVRARLTD